VTVTELKTLLARLQVDYEARTGQPLVLPATDDPNALVAALGACLADLQGRPPLRITWAPPLIVRQRPDDAPLRLRPRSPTPTAQED
jgi:hypothetical protein